MKKILGLGMLAVAVATTSGCFLRGPGDLKREVSRRADLDLDRQIGVRAGRFTLFLARQGLKIAGEADNLPLKGVRRVEVGVYEVRQPKVYYAAKRTKPSLCRMEYQDWELVVRVCGPDEHVLMFAETREDSIRGVVVVVQDQDDVVIVRARGRLDRALARVMELVDEDGDGRLFPRRGRGREAEDHDPDAPPEPMVALCEDDTLGDIGCTAPQEARERVLEVARLLAPSEEALPPAVP
jgi:hypothetical protein